MIICPDGILISTGPRCIALMIVDIYASSLIVTKGLQREREIGEVDDCNDIQANSECLSNCSERVAEGDGARVNLHFKNVLTHQQHRSNHL